MLQVFWLLLSWAMSLGEPEPLEPGTPGCFEACVKQRHAAPESRAEEGCMQDCTTGE